MTVHRSSASAVLPKKNPTPQSNDLPSDWDNAYATRCWDSKTLLSTGLRKKFWPDISTQTRLQNSTIDYLFPNRYSDGLIPLLYTTLNSSLDNLSIACSSIVHL